jgi:hypothetical protein
MTNALALLLAAATAAPAGTPAAPAVRLADPGPDRPVVHLSTGDQVKDLCSALVPAERLRARGDAVERGEAEAAHDGARDRAIQGRYEVEVPARALRFAPYDGPERRLSLAEPAQIVAGDGAIRLWPTEERGLPVEIDAAGARKVLDAQRAGTLALTLVFDLPDDVTCGPGAKGKAVTLPVEPVGWRWSDGPTTLARGGAGADRPILTVAQGARPRVAVGDPIVGPAEAKKAVVGRALELQTCYVEALRRVPSLDGVLVADLGGARPAISADSVGDAGLASCVQQALAPLAPAKAGQLAVPIRFELAPPGTPDPPPPLPEK